MAIIFNPFDGQLAQHPDYSAEFAKLDSLYFLPTPTKTSTYSANIGEEVRCDTITNGSFTVSLPTAENRESVKIIDIKGVDSITGFGANTLTVSPQPGDTIMGNSDLVIDVGATKLVLMYNDSDTDWKIVDIDSPQFTNLEWSSILGKPTYGSTSSIDLSLTGTIDNYVVEGGLVNNGVELNHLSTEVQNSLASSVKITGDQVIDGNKTFNGPFLILPNRSKINGVQHYYQNTKPDNPLELSVGDRWWKTDDGTEWFWNGTYWISPEKVESFGFTTVNSPLNRNLNGTALSVPFYVEDILHRGMSLTVQISGSNTPLTPDGSSGINSTTDYWIFACGYGVVASSIQVINIFNTQGVTATLSTNYIEFFNASSLVYSMRSSGHPNSSSVYTDRSLFGRRLGCETQRIGTALTGERCYLVATYHWIYP